MQRPLLVTADEDACPRRVYGPVRPGSALVADPQHFSYSRITRAIRPRLRVPPMRCALVALVLTLMGSALGAAGATAGPPCWKTLLTDEWDSRIDGTYSVRCYEQALKHLPEDVLVYGQAKNDLERALLNAVAVNGHHQLEGGTLVPGGVNADAHLRRGVFQRLLARLGPASPTAAPLPLLVLAGISLLLMAAAGASVAARWVYARRARRRSSPPDEEPGRHHIATIQKPI